MTRHRFSAASLTLIMMLTAGLGVSIAADKTQSEQENQPTEDIIRAGIIGTDTSHAVHFTRILNDPDAQGALARVQVVAAYPGGSPDIPSSANRVRKIADKLRGMGITIHDSIQSMLKEVDVVLLTSIDGRPHLEQAIPVIRAGKPLYIDKPLAGSLAEAIAIDMLAERHNVPWFSASSLRFGPGIHRYRKGSEKTGRIVGVSAWSPAPIEPHHPDLFWYGIHGVEILYTIMGPGCVSITRTHTKGTDVVTGTWADGRIGVFRGIRKGPHTYGAIVFGEKAIVRTADFQGYKHLVKEIAEFFVTRDPPVSNEQTLEIYTFMAAADVARYQGGEPVKLAQVRKKAREKAKRIVERIAQ